MTASIIDQIMNLATPVQQTARPGWEGFQLDPPPQMWEVEAAEQAAAATADDGGDLYEGDGSGPWLDEVVANVARGKPTGAGIGLAREPYRQMPGESVQCPNCHKMNSPDALYCDQCGHKLPDSAFTEHSNSDRQMLIELANDAANSGDMETAARQLSELGEPFIQLSNGSLAEVNQVLNRAAINEQIRQAEGELPVPRSDEDRLAYLMGRVASGSYTPSAWSFARSDPGSPWYTAPADFANAVVPTGEACGPLDLAGRCGSRYHTHGCSALAATEIGEAMAADGVYSRLAATTWADSRGHVWRDQHGELMSLPDHIRATAGIAARRSAFVTRERAEAPRATRVARVGDYDDDADPGTDLPASYRALGRKIGLAPPTTAQRERERYRELRDAALADVALKAQGRVHSDFGESVSERRARLHRPVRPVRFDALSGEDSETGEPALHGAQPRYVGG